MRLESAAWHNMGPHADWSVDLTQLPHGLVAFTGKNGRGKSFSLESAVAGACYRTMPTQGALAKRATAADSWQETTLAYGGHRYRIKHLINAVTGKGESVVVDADTGKPAYEGGTGFKLFDAWAAKHLPDPDVLFASIFAAQQSEGFVKMTSGERIGIVLRVIGVARFERMAASARKNREAAQTEVDALTRRIADIRGGSRPVAACEEDLRQAGEQVERAQEAVDTRKLALEAAKQAEMQAAMAHERRAAQLNERTRLQRELYELTEKRKPVAVRVENNRAVLAEAEVIRAAVARVETADKALARNSLALIAARTEADAARRDATDAQQRLAAAEDRGQRAAARLRDADAVRAAVAGLPEAKAKAQAAEAELTSALDALEELRGTALAGAGERIALLSLGLTDIAERRAADPVARAAAALEGDRAAVAQAESHPALLQGASKRAALANRAKDDAFSALVTLERVAARVAEIDAAETERADAVAESDRLVHVLEQAQEKATTKAEAVRILELEAGQHEANKASCKSWADKAAPLANAETRLAELEPQLAALDSDIAKIEAAIAALPPLPEVPVGSDMPRCTQALQQAEAGLQDAQRTVARAEQALEAAKSVETRAAELEAQLQQHQAEVQYWARLALDFGRDGIQSAEVDSAGPELTELINDLLRTCHGPRFTVSVETQRVSGDGKKTVEECTIRVIDTVAGTDKEIREHSGGERVILGEAVSLALTMLACRRAGWERPTLVRDESAAALDPSNARAWVAMMRRAVELTGADRLLFVSHSPEVIEMADHRIEVGS